ncbi:MAG: 4-(cytidine 5'-diphospho)-2-C-methyl-D-erythritol kinase [Oscillospiraceae bacterium]|nr:4-(cytidine 5'-diphospho)-2-C-methyl-D-erythritol kinase [Oscillospiraceae bacterium]
MKNITVKAYAKVNIFLDILSRLENGYHSLFMIMQSVSLYDSVAVTLTDRPGIIVACSDPAIPQNEGNIAYKAASKFLDFAGISGAGVSVFIEKRIPRAAGLAGGSADAAAVIRALDMLCGTGFGELTLRKIGVSVGADVPFCLTGGTLLAQNIGEVLSPLPPLQGVTFVLAKPDSSVSTKEAFAAYDECRPWQITHPDCCAALNAAANGNFGGLWKKAGNVLEQVVEVHERVRIKSVMREHGCAMCQMSGSGPTVFGVFAAREKAEACAEALREVVQEVYVCEPVRGGFEF